MVTEGRGKLGGHVASKAKSGATFFTKPRPNLTTSQYSSRQRAYFAQLSRGWSSLTAAQIQAWNDAVGLFRYTDIFGDSRTLSGKALYQRLNMNLLLTGQTLLSLPPVPGPTGVPVIDSFSVSTATGSVNLQTPNANANALVLIYATPILSTGVRYWSDQLALLGYLQLNAGGDGTLTNGYSNRYSLPAAGVNIGLAYRIIASTGQASAMAKRLFTTS